MARAFVQGKQCAVHCNKDLGDSWAVEVIPPPATHKGEKSLPPLVVKLQGEDREKVIKGALEILQKAGKIERFEV